MYSLGQKIQKLLAQVTRYSRIELGLGMRPELSISETDLLSLNLHPMIAAIHLLVGLGKCSSKE